MHGDLRGFYGSPVTYAISVAIGAATSAALLFEQGKMFILDRDAILKRHQYWRLLSSQLAFNHGIAVSFGLYIVFQYRVLERQFGSRKFGGFIFFTFLLTSLLELSALLSAPKLARKIPPGPYTILGLMTFFFYKYIPRLHPRLYHFLGLNFSDKSSTYLLLLVVIGRDVRTLFPFGLGLFFGYLFACTPFSRLRLPKWLCTCFSILSPFFEVVPASVAALQRQRRIIEAQRRLGLQQGQGRPGGQPGQGFRDQLLPGAGGMGMGGMGGMGGIGGAGLPRQRVVATPPSEDAIQQLMALGFDRERAIEALQATSNNVEAAANRLLNGL